ncbi:hypothetical protein C7M84_004581 [Penaeus vannamei]|uniref:Uncharacterized protein n=1 Tax=Penaeus vannamei TaxID=6689 RepID=A0A3R7PTR7_PENVA|nr:hypothetical protein C7M84_004581 [Penaeus vannamei]
MGDKICGAGGEEDLFVEGELWRRRRSHEAHRQKERKGKAQRPRARRGAKESQTGVALPFGCRAAAPSPAAEWSVIHVRGESFGPPPPPPLPLPPLFLSPLSPLSPSFPSFPLPLSSLSPPSLSLSLLSFPPLFSLSSSLLSLSPPPLPLSSSSSLFPPPLTSPLYSSLPSFPHSLPSYPPIPLSFSHSFPSSLLLSSPLSPPFFLFPSSFIFSPHHPFLPLFPTPLGLLPSFLFFSTLFRLSFPSPFNLNSLTSTSPHLPLLPPFFLPPLLFPLSPSPSLPLLVSLSPSSLLLFPLFPLPPPPSFLPPLPFPLPPPPFLLPFLLFPPFLSPFPCVLLSFRRLQELALEGFKRTLSLQSQPDVHATSPLSGSLGTLQDLLFFLPGPLGHFRNFLTHVDAKTGSFRTLQDTASLAPEAQTGPSEHFRNLLSFSRTFNRIPQTV